MNHDFTGNWHGWRIRGNYLVSPDGQRMTRERLDGLLFRDELELRRAGYASRRKAETGSGAKQYKQLVKVVVVDLSEYRRNGFVVA